MSMLFEREASLGKLIEVCDVALALIRERTQLFNLLRAYSVCEEVHNPFNSSLERLQHLEQVSDQIQFALRDARVKSPAPNARAVAETTGEDPADDGGGRQAGGGRKASHRGRKGTAAPRRPQEAGPTVHRSTQAPRSLSHSNSRSAATIRASWCP
jgi:hypothetical protein